MLGPAGLPRKHCQGCHLIWSVTQRFHRGPQGLPCFVLFPYLRHSRLTHASPATSCPFNPPSRLPLENLHTCSFLCLLVPPSFRSLGALSDHTPITQQPYVFGHSHSSFTFFLACLSSKSSL